MKGPLGNIMKQAQAMQENFKKAQEELAQIEVTGTSGGGLVEVVMTCRHDVRRVKIDDSLASDDKEVLEDLIAAAVNDAVRHHLLQLQSNLQALLCHHSPNYHQF